MYVGVLMVGIDLLKDSADLDFRELRRVLCICYLKGIIMLPEGPW